MANGLHFKIVVVGDIGVGKSSIISQLLTNTFRPTYLGTIGLDFFPNMLSIQRKEAKLSIWDASGREAFQSICSSYYRDTVGILLVYDITKRKTFENIMRWYNDVATHANAFAVFLLVGNKSDRRRKREVAADVAQEFAESHDFLFMETSALLNQNIDEVFEKVADEIYSRYLSGIYLLTAQSLTENNESLFKNPREKRHKRKKQCCRVMANGLHFKIVVVGDIGVGKSSIISQLLTNTFRPTYLGTIGLDFFPNMLSIQRKEAKLRIWDASGREAFQSICPSYYRDTVGVLLVYDITKRKTFENIMRWYNDVATHANAFAVFLLVGNKRSTMSLAKLFLGAVETVTGVIRQSSSWDKTMKGVAYSVKESDSLKSIQQCAATGSNNATIMHKLDCGRPHSAGPLYRRTTTDQSKRNSNIKKIHPFFGEQTEYNVVPAGGAKSASILHRVTEWLENSNIQHPTAVLKKSSGKPPIIKIPIHEYQSQKPFRSSRPAFFREIKMQRRLSWYQRLTIYINRTNDRQFHQIRYIKRRPPPYDGEATLQLMTLQKQLLRKFQPVGKFTRSVGKKDQPTQMKIQPPEMKTKPAKMKTQPPKLMTHQAKIDNLSTQMKIQPAQMKTQPPKLMIQQAKMENSPTQMKTQPAQMKTQPQKLKTRAKIENLPAQMQRISEMKAFKDHRIAVINNSEKRDAFRNKFYSYPPALAVPVIPSHKERLSDIMRQYEDAIHNVELPTHSEITASLYTPQRKLETGFTKTDAWLKELSRKNDAIIFRKHTDLITVIGFRPLSKQEDHVVERKKERKRPPIITVPVTVVNLPNTKKDTNEPGKKTGKEGTKK